MTYLAELEREVGRLRELCKEVPHNLLRAGVCDTIPKEHEAACKAFAKEMTRLINAGHGQPFALDKEDE